MDVIVLDSNAFDALLAGRLSLNAIGATLVLTTPVQEAEIKGISDPVKREALQRIMQTVQAVPAGGFSFDIDGLGFDQAEFADDLFRKLVTDLNAMHPEPKAFANRHRDAGTAWAALRRGAVLVTNDVRLGKVVMANGGAVLHWKAEG